jgi:transposase
MREKTIAAFDVEALDRELRCAKERWGLPADARVISCHEAGRDGFSIHRLLAALGIEDQMIDPGSIETSRKGRRAKTDRIDVGKLLTELVRWFEGEQRFSVCRVPSVAEEDARQLHRELEALQGERRRHRQRIQSLLATQGIRIELRRDFVERLGRLRTAWDEPIPPELRGRLEREWERLQQVEQQSALLRQRRRHLLRDGEDATLEPIRRLLELRAIGVTSSWRLGRELFCWRHFNNRRQLGALVGLCPTPHQSGTIDQELGISKAGSTWVRPLMIELAWLWLRLQPNSELSLWYQRRFAGGRRARKVGIVALARKLLVVLWRWVEYGEVPEGAVLKSGQPV